MHLIACPAPPVPPAGDARRPSRYRARHVRSGPRRPYGFRGAVAAGAAAAAGAALMIVGPAGALAPEPRQKVDRRVLVVTDGSVGVDAVIAQVDREGVPYDTADVRRSDRRVLTPVALSPGAGHGRYKGVVVPTDSVLPVGERTALAAYEKNFRVRRIVASTWADPNVGLMTVWSGPIDGSTLTVTPAARSAGFGYLVGPVEVDDRDPAVDETYGSLGAAAPRADFTPFVEARQPGGSARGAVAGVHRSAGREELVLTMALNRSRSDGMVLGRGLVAWLTKGVHLGHWPDRFSVHDDLLPGSRLPA